MSISPYQQILCLDFGTKRIGVAKSYGSLAEPLGILLNQEDIVKQVAEVCRKHEIELVVVGVSERDMAQQSRTFGRNLERELGIPVVFADETLSSRTVYTKLHQAGRRLKPGEPIDHFAAAEILQDWLDGAAEE